VPELSVPWWMLHRYPTIRRTARMKLVPDFRDLLHDKVNLDDTRLTLLNDRVDAVFDVLRADEGIGSYVKDKIPQGSWAHRTIIKPRPGHEFDADFLVRMEEIADWHDQPVEYLKYLREVLADHWRYARMPVKRKRRCVRLVYAGDCHLDIVPFVRRTDGTTWIVNGEANVWEPTNPEGYSAWMREKDEATGGNLRKVVRLLKFIRDHQNAFSGTRSIILTTVVGDRVDPWRSIGEPGYYVDVPTTLLHVVEDLDTWLQANPVKPSIADPSAPAATFDHRWTDETYTILRDDMHSYRALIHDAFHAGAAESRALWREIFGTGFPDPTPTTTGGRFGTVSQLPGRSGRAG
jgi:hypothetical protein